MLTSKADRIVVDTRKDVYWALDGAVEDVSLGITQIPRPLNFRSTFNFAPSAQLIEDFGGKVSLTMEEI